MGSGIWATNVFVRHEDETRARGGSAGFGIWGTGKGGGWGTMSERGMIGGGCAGRVRGRLLASVEVEHGGAAGGGWVRSRKGSS
jgi:hypothetical protein